MEIGETVILKFRLRQGKNPRLQFIFVSINDVMCSSKNPKNLLPLTIGLNECFHDGSGINLLSQLLVDMEHNEMVQAALADGISQPVFESPQGREAPFSGG